MVKATRSISPTIASVPGVLQAPPEFLEKLPLAIYACDAAGRILWFNSRAAELWGRSPLIGDDSEKYCGSYKLYFNGRRISREETPMASVLRTGIPIRGVEGKVERPDGSTIWAMVHIEPVRDANGGIAGAINCIHETTALHHAEDEFDDFFEDAAVGLNLISANGTILRANPAELEMLGYNADEYIGKNIRDFHLDRAAIEDVIFRLSLGEQPIEYPARLCAKDGSIRDVRITFSVRTRHGELINARCLTIDVTERLHAEAMVRDQDSSLAATYDHASIGIAEVNAEGKMFRVNPHLAALLGYRPLELVDRSIFDPALTEDTERDQELLRQQVKGEISRYSLEKRLRRSDGSGLWVSITSVSVCDDDGLFRYAVRIQQDISDRKSAEEALTRRIEEQAALYEFVEALQHAAGLEDIYKQALQAITRALKCERASILLFDASGVMKFVASRGLSHTYRRAVEGHSPWSLEAKNPLPIVIEDIEAADLPESLKEVIRTEGIGALAFIPLIEKGRLLGKFMTYYNDRHVFTRSETDLALTLARQLGFAVDRMRVEEVRQRSERAAQHLVAIVESSDDAIVSKDLNGIIATWNAGAERLFGYRVEEVIGQPITIIIPQDRLDEEPEILARIGRGERVHHYETVRRCKDGRLIDISLTISPVRDAQGRIIGASKIARDITARKQMEARLKDSERQLHELLAAIPAAIYTTDAEGKITYFNEAAAGLAGRTPVLGKDTWSMMWKLYRPDGTPLPPEECPMAIAFREGRAIRNIEVVAERPDGTRVPFIPHPTPLRDGTGKIIGVINMLIDVSERKQAETQQRMLFDELNHRVKNNMQVLQSLLYLSGKRSDSPDARRILSEAANRVAAMAAAQQVLYATNDAARFKAGEFLNAVCGAARQNFSQQVTIVYEADDVDVPNEAAMPLSLILNELLTNAVKHGATGHENSSVRVALRRKNDAFHLSVEDDGPGFDFDAVRHRSSGLRLVQGLARQLGGNFEVERYPRTRCSVVFS
jgi:PAS domain S-box-containing protein